MISQTLLLILGGCLLGAIQLVVGVVIGTWMRRFNSADVRRGRQDMARASQIARRLQALADEMSTSVGEHRSELDEASQLLKSDHAHDDQSLAELVVDVIGNVVRANQKLQAKLDTAENRLEEQAAEIEAHISRSLTDPLTGLPNRREFDERLEERMAAWNRRHEEFSLLLLDVDHFKKLNDEHGHLVGDQVLAAIGRALRGAVRREDAVARYGGEEFAVLLPCTSLEQAVHVTENVRKALAGVAVWHQQHEISVTTSGGVAAIVPDEPANSLIERADAALYAAKAAGRNRAFVHDGAGCGPLMELAEREAGAFGRAAELIELINAPEVALPVGDDAPAPELENYGCYLPREAISKELAQMCAELRQVMSERDCDQQEFAPSAAS